MRFLPWSMWPAVPSTTERGTADFMLLRLERLSQQLSEVGVFCGRDGPQVEQDAALVDAHDDWRIGVAHLCREHCFRHVSRPQGYGEAGQRCSGSGAAADHAADLDYLHSGADGTKLFGHGQAAGADGFGGPCAASRWPAGSLPSQ